MVGDGVGFHCLRNAVWRLAARALGGVVGGAAVKQRPPVADLSFLAVLHQADDAFLRDFLGVLDAVATTQEPDKGVLLRRTGGSRVGKEGVSTCRYWGAPSHKKKK